MTQSISPGRTATEFAAATGRISDPEKYYKENPSLAAKDISDCIVYVLAAPPHVQVIEFSTVLASDVYPELALSNSQIAKHLLPLLITKIN